LFTEQGSILGDQGMFVSVQGMHTCRFFVGTDLLFTAMFVTKEVSMPKLGEERGRVFCSFAMPGAFRL